jgi:hypothetical protein
MGEKLRAEAARKAAKEAALKLAGQIHSMNNGPGSPGRSSPDSAAPATPHVPASVEQAMFWKRRKKDRVKALEDRLDRVAIRQCVNEIMLATAVGFVLRSVGEDLRRQVMDELRKSVSASASSEAIALEMDERAAQLFDQIEHFARPKMTEATRH